MTIPTPGAVKPRALAPVNCPLMAQARAPQASDADLRKLIEGGREATASPEAVAAGKVAFERLSARAKTKALSV